jgi:branched-chain amino acid transport system permease protein
MSALDVLDTILQGLLLGGLYAMFAAGLSLSFGVMRLVNIAHGDFIVLAAYVALVVVNTLGMPALLSVVVVVPVLAAFGYLLQRVVLNPIMGTNVMPPLLVTFGFSVILQNLLLEIFSADSQRLDAGAIETASISLGGGLAIGWFPLIILCCTGAIIASLEALFAWTSIGRAFRAVSDDQRVSQLMGIDNRRVFAVALALALGIGAVAGVFLAIGTTFSPALGPSRLLFAFEAVIIGGMGSLWGTLAGGAILGVGQSFGFRYDPGWGILAGHIAFLAVLVVRPQGLFPKTRAL